MVVIPSLVIVALLLIMVPSISVHARRLHDINLSGWWQAIPRILAVLSFVFTPATETPPIEMNLYVVILNVVTLVVYIGFYLLLTKPSLVSSVVESNSFVCPQCGYLSANDHIFCMILLLCFL